MLDAISIPPTNGKPPQGLFVALHGWGSNAQDARGLSPFLELDNYQLIFPNAPFPNPQVPGGRQWYDLSNVNWYDFNLSNFNYEGLRESQEILKQWLQSLENDYGIPLEKTVLAGFSQGGAMTLDVGLSLPLAAVCSLSGYLHAQPQVSTTTLPPTLIIHGTQDSVVPLKRAHQAREVISALGSIVEYHELEIGHQIEQKVLKLLNSFVARLEIIASQSTQ